MIVYLHIGTRKTGTKAIQQLLYHPQNRVYLEKNSITYPNALGANASNWVINAFAKNKMNYHFNVITGKSEQVISAETDTMTKAFEKEMHQLKTNTLVISGESIFYLEEEELKAFKTYLETVIKQQIEFKIILFLRNPIDYTQSLMQQFVKTKYDSLEGLRELFLSIPNPYKSKIEKFESVFSLNAISLHSYDQIIASSKLLVDYFLEVIKDKTMKLPFYGESQQINESSSQVAIEIVSLINKEIPFYLEAGYQKKPLTTFVIKLPDHPTYQINPERKVADIAPLLKIPGPKFKVNDEQFSKQVKAQFELDYKYIEQKFQIDLSKDYYKKTPHLHREKWTDETLIFLEHLFPKLEYHIRQYILVYVKHEIELASDQTLIHNLKELYLKMVGLTVVHYGCVVDNSELFMYQCWQWIQSLIKLAQIKPSCLFVHFTPNVEPEFIEKCQELGVNTSQITPYGDFKYCNKIQQIFQPEFIACDCIVMMDTDMIVVENFESSIDYHVISGKIVDEENPSSDVLEGIFEHAAIQNTLSKVEIVDEKTYTFQGNFNGGLYIIPKQFISELQNTWKKWAEWLLDNQMLHAINKGNHVDQVSFCLTVHDKKLPIKQLEMTYNFPLTHWRNGDDMAIKVIHYHHLLEISKRFPLEQYEKSPQIYQSLRIANEIIDRHILTRLNDPTKNETLILKKVLIEKCPNIFGKELILHLGTPKTGTKSIQKTCVLNEMQLTHEHILYPKDKTGDKHQGLVNALLNEDWNMFVEYFAGMNESLVGMNRVILSAEGLYNHLYDFSPKALAWINQLSKLIKVTGIIYIRNQKDYYIALYKQSIINPKEVHKYFGTHLKLNQYYKQKRVSKLLNYEKSLSKWTTILGKDNLVIRPYCANVTDDFRQYLNISPWQKEDYIAIHKSFSDAEIELIRVNNKKMTQAMKKDFMSVLEQNTNKNTKYHWNTHWIERRIRNDFYKSNCTLVKVYPQLIPILFRESLTLWELWKKQSFYQMIKNTQAYFIIQKSRQFDPSFYEMQYPLNFFYNQNRLWHYLLIGVHLNKEPSRYFKQKQYLLNNPDVAQSGLNPFAHYIRHGTEEGRIIE